MLHFRLRTLETAEADSERLACWELAAFYLGSASVRDLEMDKDRATEWYVDTILASAERDDYRAEPQMAEDEMLDSFSSALREMARKRSQSFRDYYPFEIDDVGGLHRKPLDQLTPVGTSYLALQFFRALRRGFVEFDGPDDETAKKSRAKFDKTFRKIFEFMAGYAVAGKKAGTPYMLSDCRNSERLHALLEGICARVQAGRVIRYDDWNAIQKNANDGGVDCLIHVGGPDMPGYAHIELVGATVQEANIDQKIIGRDEREFFGGFFAEKPAVFHGALARPQDEDDLTKAKCVDRDCLLYSYDDIWKGMAVRPANGEQLMAMKRLDAGIRKLLKEFEDAVFLHKYDEYRISAA